MKGIRTKEKLLRIGLDQVSVEGISGITLGQLATASGLSKSGLFAHFRSKKQLQIEILDESAQLAQKNVVDPAMREDKGLPRIKALVKLWLGWYQDAGLKGGCPVAAVLFELDDIDSDIRKHAKVLEAQWHELLCQLVSEAVAMRHLSTNTDVEQFVWELCGIYLAHHSSSRFRCDKDADRRAERAFENLVDRYSYQETTPNE